MARQTSNISGLSGNYVGAQAMAPCQPVNLDFVPIAGIHAVVPNRTYLTRQANEYGYVYTLANSAQVFEVLNMSVNVAKSAPQGPLGSDVMVALLPNI